MNHLTKSENDINLAIIYPPQKKIEAMRWLKENTDHNDIIMAQYTNGNFMPAITGRHVFVGHGIETIDFKIKYSQNEALFNKQLSDEYIQKILAENKINYIFFSLFEKYHLQWNPEKKEYLNKVFDNQEVQIYKVL